MQSNFSGKVRELYNVSDDSMIIVTTDRISAFDVIIPRMVKNKGVVLNQISNYFFDKTKDIIPNHLISTKQEDFPEQFQAEEYKDRTILVKKLKMLPYEIIVRGYMFGTMWNAYKANEPFCGYTFEGEYQQAQKLAAPIVTPSTKAEEGHDIYVDMKVVAADLGQELTDKVEKTALMLYKVCTEDAASKGIIIADTKFEFGLDENGELVLADEIFTPDSSRFWDAAEYKIGTSPRSYDKQFIRDWLLNNKKDGEFQFDAIPQDVIDDTSKIYAECLAKLKG